GRAPRSRSATGPSSRAGPGCGPRCRRAEGRPPTPRPTRPPRPTRRGGAARRRSPSLHLVGDHLALDLLVGRHGNDLLLVQLVLGLVGTALDDLLRVRVADARERLELVFAGGVEVELVF